LTVRSIAPKKVTCAPDDRLIPAIPPAERPCGRDLVGAEPLGLPTDPGGCLAALDE
jgi:hypothetical protein